MSTESVLSEVAAERARQTELWGEQNLPDGTGPALYLAGLFRSNMARSAELARLHCDLEGPRGRVTWRTVLLEEVLEALAESDPDRLRAELIQVAAVAAQWVEALDRRQP